MANSGYTLADRRSPSIKRLMEIDQLSFEDAEKIKKIWATVGKRAEAMEQINAIIHTFGREYMGLHRRRHEHVYYLNAGDSYNTTIIQIGVQLTVGCWADLVERNLIKETQY